MAGPGFEALLSAAMDARRAGELEEASRVLREALAVATAAGDLRQRVTANRGLGHVASDQGQHARAPDAYQAAVDDARLLGDACLLAHALRHLGRAQARLGRMAEALATCGEAVALYRTRPDADPLDVANALRAQARVLEEAGRGEQSLASWREALPLYERAGVADGVAECRARLG